MTWLFHFVIAFCANFAALQKVEIENNETEKHQSSESSVFHANDLIGVAKKLLLE